MDKEYYKEYYHLERNHWWFKARLEILESLFETKIRSDRQNLTILNAGAATGATSEMLKRHGRVTTLEYDKDCSLFLEGILNEKIVNASLTELPFEDNSFDVVCAFDVIEHIEDDKKAVSEMYRVLKTGGIVFITVPAFMSMWSEHDEINHHFRRYKLKQLIQLHKNEGFNITFSSYFNFYLFLPIYVVRSISNLLKGSAKKESSATTGSDFEKANSSGLVNKLLFYLFRSERTFLKNNITLPFGVSALLIGKK